MPGTIGVERDLRQFSWRTNGMRGSWIRISEKEKASEWYTEKERLALTTRLREHLDANGDNLATALTFNGYQEVLDTWQAEQAEKAEREMWAQLITSVLFMAMPMEGILVAASNKFVALAKVSENFKRLGPLGDKVVNSIEELIANEDKLASAISGIEGGCQSVIKKIMGGVDSIVSPDNGYLSEFKDFTIMMQEQMRRMHTHLTNDCVPYMSNTELLMLLYLCDPDYTPNKVEAWQRKLPQHYSEFKLFRKVGGEISRSQDMSMSSLNKIRRSKAAVEWREVGYDTEDNAYHWATTLEYIYCDNGEVYTYPSKKESKVMTEWLAPVLVKARAGGHGDLGHVDKWGDSCSIQ